VSRVLIRLVVGVVIISVLAACGASDTADRRAAAAAAARQYFEALSTNDSDLGWSLIDDTMGWSDFAAYQSAVESADLDGFQVTVTETIRCDEGYACRVCLELPDPQVTPDLLRSNDGRAFDGIIMFDEALPCGNAMIGVGLDPFTGSPDGVWIGP